MPVQNQKSKVTSLNQLRKKTELTNGGVTMPLRNDVGPFKWVCSCVLAQSQVSDPFIYDVSAPG